MTVLAQGRLRLFVVPLSRDAPRHPSAQYEKVYLI
jgi:hypothetical protein